MDVKKIGKYIGSGVEGIVFEYENDKIIKLMWIINDKRYDSNRISKIINLIKLHPKSKLFPIIYESGKIKQSKEINQVAKIPANLIDFVDNEYMYYYICEKLHGGISEKRFNEKLPSLRSRLYKMGMYFRDPYYKNIMISKNGTIKICDLTAIEPREIR